MAVKLEYMYRDAANYKEFGYVIFEGHLQPGDGERLRRAAEGGCDFVATQVGLPPLQEQMLSFPSPDDHGTHELIDGGDPEEVPDDEGVTDSRIWAEFLTEFEAAGKAGWDPVAECEQLGIDPTATWDDTESEEE